MKNRSSIEASAPPHPDVGAPGDDEAFPTEPFEDMAAGLIRPFVTDAELNRIGRHWRAVADAATSFEQRWMMGSLKRVAPELAVRLEEQRSLTDKAFATGTPEDVDLHAPAMVRGWQAAVRAMEEAGKDDDAYMVGSDPATGFRVAISAQRASAARVAEVVGKQVVFVSPDEVAAILGSLEQFKAIAAVKRMFPGAEVVDRFPDEPAKADVESSTVSVTT